MNINLRNAHVEDAVSIGNLSVQLGYDMNVTQTKKLLDEVLYSEQGLVLVALYNDDIVILGASSI